ncbi:TIGR03792 family protein [Nostoc sp. FACHB-110]|uniref:TIGR03792 family protein n=1 Tax=Nostoc sp. FACHB-110 TaxID=2692834 RepID=UPI0016895BE6|nr:TIGR03792 family protein [Nostoc sp. FACHB-110]MBD2440625.1 TIGR03792 family protein [Nostoc sp. FACHB-110]
MSVVIELLKFRVNPHQRENFIQKDAEIWTTALAKYPGFLSKEVWINPNNPTEVIFLIRWNTLEQWQAVPQADLEQIEQQFAQAVGDIYQLVEVTEYQVRKFPQT